MSDNAEPLLFEAVSRPQQSLNRTGMRVVALLLAAAFALAGVLFLILGAWPVLGFAGGELLLVFGLFALHRSRARRCVEMVSLGRGALRIRRTDGTGRAADVTLDPYWARVSLGADGRLMVGHRGQQQEIGLFLNADEKTDLAGALEAALGRYREPHFDNPQLR